MLYKMLKSIFKWGHSMEMTDREYLEYFGQERVDYDAIRYHALSHYSVINGAYYSKSERLGQHLGDNIYITHENKIVIY